MTENLKKIQSTEAKYFLGWSKVQRKVLGYRSRKTFNSCLLFLRSILYTTLDETGLPSSQKQFPKQYVFEWKLQPDPEYYLISLVKTTNADAFHLASVGRMSRIRIGDFQDIFRKMEERGFCPIRSPDPICIKVCLWLLSQLCFSWLKWEVIGFVLRRAGVWQDRWFLRLCSMS